MAKVKIDPKSRVREARARYFAENDFGPDGGYREPWVFFHMGPLTVPVPNTRSRRYAVPYHDLHHLVTGYDTDWRGEFEISAWELGAGCKDAGFAWMINLGGMVGGLLTMPARTVSAFRRGRGCRSLYGQPVEALLDDDVATLRRRVGV